MSFFKSHIAQMGACKPPLEGRNKHKHLLLDHQTWHTVLEVFHGKNQHPAESQRA